MIMKEKWDNNNLSALVPSIRKNFKLLEEGNENSIYVTCLHCGEVISKRILEIASHDSYCGGKENHQQITELVKKYNNGEITIEELNATAIKIFEIEDDELLLFKVDHFTNIHSIPVGHIQCVKCGEYIECGLITEMVHYLKCFGEERYDKMLKVIGLYQTGFILKKELETALDEIIHSKT